jgi:O-methyltransferase
MLFIAKRTNSEYHLVIPIATYAPWTKDQDFMDLYHKIKYDTLANIYQLWELWKMVEETKHLDGDVIEIGTYRGGSAAIIAKKLLQLENNKTVYACDTFEGVVKASNKDNYFKGGEYKDTSLDYIKNKFKKSYNINNVSFLKGIFPEETGHIIKDKSFSLCHIDVDTYDSGKDIISWIWNKIPIGGIILFNDYGYQRTQGITKLLNEYREANNSLVIHNLNGNGILIKLK